ncbi:MAG TPA: PorV/PorQ family protein [bacterium]|nr:PorV/PorQ family protein [bacterium]
MKKIISILTLMVVFGLFAVPDISNAQPVKYGQAGMKFLTIDVGGRLAAMGGTAVGVAGDASAMFTNPAGLSIIQGVDAMAGNTSWIADINHFGAAVAYGAGQLGTFGVSLVSMDYGEFTKTVPYSGFDPEDRAIGYIDQGTFTVTEYAFGLSYARQIMSQFYIGGSVKYAYQNLGDVVILDQFLGEERKVENDISNLVFDFGTLYYPGFRDLRFGVTIRNFSNQADYYDQRFELPLTFDFGMAMDLMQLWSPGNNGNRITLAVDAIHPRDYSERLHTGLEYSFSNMLFLRGGYKFNYDEEGLTAGIGVRYGLQNVNMRVDYAYSAFGIFDAVHRFSLGVTLQ